MKFNIEEIKAKINKKNIINVFLILIQIFLLFKVVSNLVYGMESMFQIERDIYFYKVVIYFCIEILVLRKTRIYRPQYLVTILGYSIYVVKTLQGYTLDLYGETMIEWEKLLLFSQGFFLLTIVDSLFGDSKPQIKWSKSRYKIFTVVTLALALGFNYNYSRPILFPIIALFLTHITIKEWERFLDCFVVGYYLTFLWIFTKSLMTVSYTSGHYIGTFLNYATAGSFCAGAFICALYGFIKVQKAKSRIGMIAAGLAMIYPIVAVLMFGERSSELALLMVAFGAIVFVMGMEKENAWKKRGIIGVISLFGILVVFLVFLLTISRLDAQEIRDRIPNEALAYKAYYWIKRGKTLMNFNSKINVLPDGFFLNPIDWFSSDRLSYFVDSIQKTKLFGSDDITVGNGHFFNTNPHNSYAAWLRKYGWIGGSIFIGWFFVTLTKVTREITRHHREFILPFLWLVFGAVYGLTETVLWTYPVGFVMLIMIHPLINGVAMSEKKKGKIET